MNILLCVPTIPDRIIWNKVRKWNKIRHGKTKLTSTSAYMLIIIANYFLDGRLSTPKFEVFLILPSFLTY